jgi:hypothetical protein
VLPVIPNPLLVERIDIKKEKASNTREDDDAVIGGVTAARLNYCNTKHNTGQQTCGDRAFPAFPGHLHNPREMKKANTG